MGSLMAGWDSPFRDPKSIKCQRNKSLTREEIDAFWKSKQKTVEEHLSEISDAGYRNQENLYKVSAEGLQRSSSLPHADKRESLLNSASKPDGDELGRNSCWWTRSRWAFLNEPPVVAMEGPSYKYASQHNVTELSSTKVVNNSKIST